MKKQLRYIIMCLMRKVFKMSYAKIGKVFGLTRSRAHQIINKTL